MGVPRVRQHGSSGSPPANTIRPDSGSSNVTEYSQPSGFEQPIVPLNIKLRVRLLCLVAVENYQRNANINPKMFIDGGIAPVARGTDSGCRRSANDEHYQPWSHQATQLCRKKARPAAILLQFNAPHQAVLLDNRLVLLRQAIRAGMAVSKMTEVYCIVTSVDI
jgi:hypothetical protein